MDTTRIKKLTSFLTAQIYKSPEDDKIRSFVLFHSKPGGVLGRQIDTYTPSEVNRPEDIAKEILFSAQSDADVYPLLQHYIVMAYRESDLENAIASLPFRLRPKQHAADSEASEPPTKDGLTAQLMRHLETVNNNQAAWQQGVFQQVLKFVSLQSDELSRYRQLNHEVHEAREQLMLERVSVQHAANLREIEESSGVDDTKKIIAETAAKYLPMAMPVLINGVTQMVQGKKGVAPQLQPPNESPGQQALPFDVGAVIASLDEEQKHQVLASIAQQLSPEEIQNLGQMFMMLSAGEKEEKVESCEVTPAEPTAPPKPVRKKPTKKKRSKKNDGEKPKPATDGSTDPLVDRASEAD